MILFTLSFKYTYLYIINTCSYFLAQFVEEEQTHITIFRLYRMSEEGNFTAKAWILMNGKTGVYLRGQNTQTKREIASLTKMYTLYACLTLNIRLGIDPKLIYVQIFPTGATGTLANLIPNQFISLLDLYYGLMLPSGNDAACILSAYYGSWIYSNKTFLGLAKVMRKQSIKEQMKYLQLFSKKFIQYVNIFVVKQELRHVNTHFQNCHGLCDKNQVSTAWQLAQASLKFMKNELFRKICGTKRYKGYYCSDAAFQWENTNILLESGFIGIKTGYTTSAGGCLSSLLTIKTGKYQSEDLLMVVIGSTNSETRFSDTQAIVRDYQQYLRLMKL